MKNTEVKELLIEIEKKRTEMKSLGHEVVNLFEQNDDIFNIYSIIDAIEGFELNAEEAYVELKPYLDPETK